MTSIYDGLIVPASHEEVWLNECPECRAQGKVALLAIQASGFAHCKSCDVHWPKVKRPLMSSKR